MKQLHLRCRMIAVIAILALLHTLSFWIAGPPTALFGIWTILFFVSIISNKHLLAINFLSLNLCAAFSVDIMTKIILLAMICHIIYRSDSPYRDESKLVSTFMLIFLIGFILCVSNIPNLIHHDIFLGIVSILAAIGLSIAYIELWHESMPNAPAAKEREY